MIQPHGHVIDAAVGRLRAGLAARVLSEDTLIMFLGDNGYDAKAANADRSIRGDGG